MYIPVSEDGKPFHHEGFVVRFLAERHTPWVANFRTGLTSYSATFEFSDHRRVLVIAGGQAYLMDPERTTPSFVFGGQIEGVLHGEGGVLVFDHQIRILLLYPRSGLLWASSRISWDGFRNMRISDHSVVGESWRPFPTENESDEWSSFELDLLNKTLVGGSYPAAQRASPGMAEFPAQMLCDDLWSL
jgi:hypothetical protein